MRKINARVGNRGNALFAILLAGLFLMPLPSSLASTNADGAASLKQILAEELEEHPGGEVVGNEIHYDDGLVFVAVPVGTFSLSQCTSGRFCGWANAGYTGSFYWVSGSGTVSLSWTARSFSNNRSGTARLYNAAGTTSLCFPPRQNRTSIASSHYNPSKVSLGSGTSC
jgi:hypothetical protein